MLSFTPSDPAILIRLIITGISVVGIAVVSYHIYCLLTRPKKETKVNAYLRTEPKLDKFLESAKKKINIFGITLEETTRDFRDTCQEILKKHSIEEVNILLSDPDVNIRPYIERQVHENIGTIASSIETLRSMKKDLSPDEFAKLHVKLSNEIPVQSIFIIDPDEKHSVIRFEPYVYGITKQRRRIFEMSKKKQKELYKVYLKSFNELWKLGMDKPL
jgi:hypothetical protein